MKKTLAILLTLAMLFSLAACGGGSDDEKTPAGNNTQSSQQEQNNPGTSQQGEAQVPVNRTPLAELTLENWQQVAKENFEIDITLPDGWQAEKVEATSEIGAKLTFGGPEKITNEEAFAFFETFFTKLKEVGAVSIQAIDVEYETYAQAHEKGQFEFDVMMNSDATKTLFMGLDTVTEVVGGEVVITGVEVRLSAKGDWNVPTGDTGYPKFEAYTGMTGIQPPDGFYISRHSTYDGKELFVRFNSPDDAVTEEQLSAYAAHIFERSVEAADGGKIFMYHVEKGTITQEYSSVEEAFNYGQYRWFYETNGKRVCITMRIVPSEYGIDTIDLVAGEK